LIPSGTPEDMSRTPNSLPGDAIIHFRVAKLEGRDLVIEVDYRYNSQHGDNVLVGASLKGVPSGYLPTRLPPARDGTVVLNMSAIEAGSSEALEIFLFENGRPAEPFARRTFPYRMRFE